jgi:hypothetical protein
MSSYNILGDLMNNKCNKGNSFLSVLFVLILSCLIFYQVIITLILPFRFNIFILLIEIFILFAILARIVWPY